ncbi:adenylate cyclase type 10-like isoform X2 [Mauremys reevesii]|uniref:adenylate cyclase type 10-like isoform X2 n=1 Tax=Mauremys reevesii TaxID=260615 RepID=UPI00193ED8E4|nr:adenylate cyclase type 10-like isoform X2 [Mauremys reevesii]
MHCWCSGRAVCRPCVSAHCRQYLLVTGQQVDDVRLAQSLAQAREVILSLNCWELCDRDVLEAEMLKGQKAMKIFHPPEFDKHFEKCIDHLQHYPNYEVLLRKAVALASSRELELALRRFVLGNVLKKAAEEATPIFIIDEAQYIDAASWDFLAKLLSNVPIFIVLSLSPFASKELLPCASAQGIMKSPKTTGVVLQELEPSKLLEMARQALGVVSIPREMEIFLIQRSSGVPLYCEALLTDLHANEVLEFYRIPEEDEWDNLSRAVLSEEEVIDDAALPFATWKRFHCLERRKTAPLVWPGAGVIHLRRCASAVKSIPYRAPLVSSKEDKELYICTTRKDVDLDAVLLPARLKDAAKRTDVPLGQELTIETPMASCEDNLQCRAKSAMNKQVLPDDHLRVEQEFLDRVDKMIKYHKRGKEEATNLAPCECGERVESVVSALARHCLMVNDRTRAFYYLLESAAASLYLSNNYMAYLYLKKASGLQELSALAVFPCLKRPKLKINPFEEATFCSLRGEVCFNMGQITLAKKLIKRALCLLHKGFPRTWLGAFFQSLLEESKHSAYHTQQHQAQHTDRKALAVLQQQIHCLSLLWQLYSLDSTANRKYSRLAALMEINLADASENKMQIISTYMDFSQFSQSMGYKDEWLKYEMMAIQRSSQCNFTFTRERLLMTAQLAQALAYSKLCLGHLTRSIQLGFQAHTMCVCLRKTSLHCLVLSLLFKSAFLKNKYAQCIRVLEWLWELATQEESIIVLACFYSACLDLLLCDAEFDYRPIEECLQFINQYEASCILKSQSNILLSLYSSLAIWFGRLQQWDLFEDNFTKAQRLVSRTNASLFGTHGFFRFLECQGLLLRRVMEDTPEKYFEEFLSHCSTSPVYHTRVYSLKASVNLLGDEDKSQVPLSKGLKLSATSHNRLEETTLSVSPDHVQNKNQGSGRVEELKDSKDQDEEGTREYMKSVTSRLKSKPRLEELTFVHLQLGLPTGEPMEYISTAPCTLPSTSRKPQGDGDKV